MPPRLRPVNTATVARRLELQPDTVTLDEAKAIFNRLGLSAEMDGHSTLKDGHSSLKAEAYALAARVQELIDTPEPLGLVTSARMILALDDLVLAGHELRIDVAETYDRFDKHTTWATDALEILTAIVVKLEAADLELRTGTRAA